MINHIIQVILFQVLFLAIYDLFLSKETFFTKNRWYLLSAPILSFLIPFIKIPTFQKAVPQEFIVYLPEIVLSPEKVIQETAFYQSINYVNFLFWLGVVIFTVLFLVKLYKIFNLIRSSESEKQRHFTLVMIPNKTNAFSFFNFIFLGKNIPKSQQAKIIAHELVHSKQKHSLDLLFFELLKIVMWFNPMIFLYQKRITLIHEYISDAIASKSTTKKTYINYLLSNFFQVENIAFVNQFYKETFIKKRIIMMTKKQSKKMNQLKYLVLIPVLASMLFYTSCAENEVKEEVVAKLELSTMYMQIGKQELKESIGKKESYLDSYIGTEIPKWEEISYDNLSIKEKIEYDEKINKINESDTPVLKSLNIKLYKGDKGRNIIGNIINTSKMKNLREKSSDGSVSFMTIDKAPTFPGCNSGDKDCFSKEIKNILQEILIQNFQINWV
jgi:beta-lactamase regulating signal transducer with metallopeptidase domain